MPSDNIEREVKLEVGLRFTLPDLDGVVPGVTAVPLPEIKLRAVYIDTPDLRLMRWGITLRHRQDDVAGGRGESGWTVKLPERADSVAMVRRELFWPGRLGPVPAEVSSLVRASARGAPLGPVAKLTTQRRRVELLGPSGVRWAEIDDDVVSVLDGRRLAARFREVEVELTDAATPELLEAVLERMTAAGALRGDDRPKVVRALGPRATAPPDVVVPELDRDSTIAEVIRASIASGMTRMVRHDPGVRLGDDPEHVHQARVGTRRLRSDLRTFHSLLDTDWTTRVRADLGWVAAALGAVRDADVLTERLRAQIAVLPDLDRRPSAALLRRLALQRNEARGEMLAVLDSDRYIAVLEELARGAADPPLAKPAALDADPPLARPVAGASAVGAAADHRPAVGAALAADPPAARAAAAAAAEFALAATDIGAGLQPASREGAAAAPLVEVGQEFAVTTSDSPSGPDSPPAAGTPPPGDERARNVLPRLVRKPWRRLQKAVDSLGEDPPDEALHEVRIRAKRARYAAEAAEPVIGKPAMRFADAVAEVQGVLGDMHDAVVAENWLRQAGSTSSAAQALVAGELVTRQRDEQAACRKAWVKPWKVASKKKLRSWLSD